MWLKQIPRAIYWTFVPVRCDECKLKKPAFNFPCLNWLGVSYCRHCWNHLFPNEEPWDDYYQPFDPLRDIIAHFKDQLLREDGF